MRITYFTNTYPAVSHTFIRREILELEKQGFIIQRLSLRSPKQLVDDADNEELKMTTMLLELSFFSFTSKLITRISRNPLRAICQIRFLRQLWTQGNKPLKIIGYFAEASVLAELCKTHESQHLRVHFGTNGAIVARLCRRLGGPEYSIAYHGPDEFDNTIKWDIGGVVSESAFVTAITSYCSAQIMRWTPRSQWEHIHIVRCAVDNSFLEIKPLPSDDRRYLCIVARLSAQKGLPLLLDGFVQAVEGGADIGLHIVGDGEMRDEIENLISKLKLNDRINVHGSLSGEGVRSVIAKSCAIVLPSFAEGLPVVLMEAMGMGRPAITSAIAGIPELVHHRENGWLIPSGSVPELAESLENFAQLPFTQLSKMGLNGHHEVNRQHSIENEAMKLKTLIIKYSTGI
ncbi:MAG: glycosyltransferase family 4 protein [Phycisphaerales bacterium]|nr:glycosyltransferase family 4 protein [Phycisphaerales bacterium]